MTATEQQAARDRYRELAEEFFMQAGVSLDVPALAAFARWLDEGGRLTRRRPRGAGENVDHASAISNNEAAIFGYLRRQQNRGSYMTVREVAAGLYRDNVGAQGRPWNYHIVQLTLSKLVGRGLIEADASKRALRYRARS